MNKHKSIKKYIRQMKSNKGESLAETLVAVLIAAIAMAILAGAIGTAGRVGRISKEAYVYMDSGKGSITESGAGITLQEQSIETDDLEYKVYKDKYNKDGTTIEYYYWIPSDKDTD